MTNRNACRVRFKHLKSGKKKKSKASGGYLVRNRNLTELGYSSYRDYLASDDWQELRRDRLDKHPSCSLCGSVATQVHHFSYEYPVLLGLIPELLFPLCQVCHEDVEFSGKTKRTLGDSQEWLLLMFENSGRSCVAESIRAHHKKSVGWKERPTKRRPDNCWKKLLRRRD